jgi:hypothetical protein
VAKTFWVFFVIILPWLGILVYLIAPRPRHAAAPAGAGTADERGADGVHPVRRWIFGWLIADQIASAKSLLDSGAITQAEFEP